MTPLAILAVSLGAEVTGRTAIWTAASPSLVLGPPRRWGPPRAQDGSAVTPDLTAFVYSTAVETANPDFRRASRREPSGARSADCGCPARDRDRRGRAGKSTSPADARHRARRAAEVRIGGLDGVE